MNFIYRPDDSSALNVFMAVWKYRDLEHTIDLGLTTADLAMGFKSGNGAIKPLIL